MFTFKPIIARIELKSAILLFLSICFLCCLVLCWWNSPSALLTMVQNSPCAFGRFPTWSRGWMSRFGLYSALRLGVGTCQAQVTFFCRTRKYLTPSCNDVLLVLASQASSCSPSYSFSLGLNLYNIYSSIFLLTISLCVLHVSLDFPGGSDGKESTYNAGDPGLFPGLGRSPGEENGNPLQYSCLENPTDREACRLKSMGSQKVGQNWATNTVTFSWIDPVPMNEGSPEIPSFPWEDIKEFTENLLGSLSEEESYLEIQNVLYGLNVFIK